MLAVTCRENSHFVASAEALPSGSRRTGGLRSSALASGHPSGAPSAIPDAAGALWGSGASGENRLPDGIRRPKITLAEESSSSDSDSGGGDRLDAMMAAAKGTVAMPGRVTRCGRRGGR